MKTSPAKKLSKSYACRKCSEDGFKTFLEFTKHLRKCRGVPILTMPRSNASKTAPTGNGMRAELVRLRALGVEIQILVDRLLKRVK